MTARRMPHATLPIEEVLSQNAEVASTFHVAKTKREAAKNWNRFYTQHGSNFFKDRHWTTREFEDLADLGVANELGEESSGSVKGKGRALLEVGCGAGNCLFPLLERFPDVRCHACDFSQKAVELVQAHPLYAPERLNAFVHDLTVEEPSLRSLLGDAFDGEDAGGIDVCTCLFVLSAIPPEKLLQAARSIASALKPGGVLLFRDYGLHDSAQLRFHTRASANYSEPSRLSADSPLYRRADQTLTYFFTPEEIEALFAQVGLTGRAEYVTRDLENRKEQWTVERRFVQGRFVVNAS